MSDASISGTDEQAAGPRRSTKAPTSTEAGGFTRLNINLNDDAADAVREIAQKRRISITEVIRRAIAILAFIEKEAAAGNKIQVVDQSGHVREVVLI